MGIAVDNSGCAYVIATTYDSDFWPHSFVAKITTGNNPPTANAGPDQTVHIGNSATLDDAAPVPTPTAMPSDLFLEAVASWPGKDDGYPAPILSVDPSSPSKASFNASQMGNYVAQLVVTDSKGAASPQAMVTISTTNSKPVAAAGPDQAIIVIGSTVQLNGSRQL